MRRYTGIIFGKNLKSTLKKVRNSSASKPQLAALRLSAAYAAPGCDLWQSAICQIIESYAYMQA